MFESPSLQALLVYRIQSGCFNGTWLRRKRYDSFERSLPIVPYTDQSQTVASRWSVPDTWHSGGNKLELVLNSSRLSCSSYLQFIRLRMHPSCFETCSYLLTWKFRFCRINITQRNALPVMLDCSQMIILDSQRIADAMVCVCRKLLRYMSE